MYLFWLESTTKRTKNTRTELNDVELGFMEEVKKNDNIMVMTFI